MVKQSLNSPAYRATQEADSRTALAAARDFEPDLVVTPNVAVHKIGIVVGIVPITVQRTRDAMNWHPTPGFICGCAATARRAATTNYSQRTKPSPQSFGLGDEKPNGGSGHTVTSPGSNSGLVRSQAVLLT